MSGVTNPAQFLAKIATEYTTLDDAKVGQFIDSLPERAGECEAAEVIARQLTGQLAMTKDLLDDAACASRRHAEIAFVYLAWQRYEDALAGAAQISRDDAARGAMRPVLAGLKISAFQAMGQYEQADGLVEQLVRDAKEEQDLGVAFLDLQTAVGAVYRAGDLDRAEAFAELAGEVLSDLGEEDGSIAASHIAIWRARNLVGMGQPRQAEELIRQKASSYADEVGVVGVRIKAMQSQWRIDDATALAERAAKHNPLPDSLKDWVPDDENVLLHFLLASMYRSRGRYRDAGNVLDKIINLAPYFLPAHAMRCQLMAWHGARDEAVGNLRKMHEQYPYDQQAPFMLAFLQLVWHHYDETAVLAEALNRTYRFDSAAYQLRVVALARGRKLAQAQAAAAEGLKRYPRSYGLRVQRGWVRFAQLDFDGAQEDFQSVLDAVPLAPHAMTGMAAIHFQHREYEKALELFQKVANESADSGPHASLAWVLAAFGKDHEANAECNRALEHDMPSASALTCRSVLAFRDGRLGDALRTATEAVDCDPADLSCKVNLATLLSENGDYEAARHLLEQVLDDDPRFAYAHFELGMLDTKTGHLDSAGQRLRRAIDVDPRLSEAYQALGDLDLKAGRLAAAETRLREGLRWAPPADATLHVTLAQVLRELGDANENDNYYHEALKELQTARQRNPNSNTALFELGAIQLRLGDIPRARQAFKKMLDNDKDDPYAQVMLARISRTASVESRWLRAWSVALAVVAGAQAAVAWIVFLWGKLSITGLISLITLFALMVVVAPLLPRLTKLHLASLEADITQVQIDHPTKTELIARPVPAFGLAPAAPAISSAIWIME